MKLQNSAHVYASVYTRCVRRQLTVAQRRQIREALDQSKDLNQTTLAKLLHVSPSALNRWLTGDTKPSEEQLTDLLAALGLESELLPTGVVYIASPITALEPDGIRRHYEQVSKIVSVLDAQGLVNYWPGANIHDRDDYSVPDISAETHLPYLESCRGLLYVQFEATSSASGSFVELGIALGLGRTVVIVHGRGVELPYILRGFGSVAAHLAFLPDVHIYPVADENEACQLLRTSSVKLFRERGSLPRGSA